MALLWRMVGHGWLGHHGIDLVILTAIHASQIRQLQKEKKKVTLNETGWVSQAIYVKLIKTMTNPLPYMRSCALQTFNEPLLQVNGDIWHVSFLCRCLVDLWHLTNQFFITLLNTCKFTLMNIQQSPTSTDKAMSHLLDFPVNLGSLSSIFCLLVEDNQ